MDTRFKKEGYSVTCTASDYGGFMDIKKDGQVIAGMSVGFFSGGPDSLPSLDVRYFERSFRRLLGPTKVDYHND